MGEVSAQVGFGTTSPSNDIDVESNSGTATAVDINCTGAGDPTINFQLNGTSTFSMGIDNSDADKFKIGTSALETSTRLTIDASGNVGIGTSSPSAKLHVNGSIYMPTNNYIGPDAYHMMKIGDGVVDKTTYINWGGIFVPSSLGSQGHCFYSVIGLQLQLASDAAYFGTKVLVGTTNTSYMLAVNGQPGANGYTAFTNYSDSRLKTNISSLDTGALSKIMQLRPVSFQYNQKYLQLYPNSDLQKVRKGFIAQEIRQVFPEMVSKMKASPDSVQYLDLDVSHLQVYLVKALQEQQAIINAQKSEIDAQKSEIDALKQNALKVAALENKMNAMLLLLNNKQELTVKQ